MSSPNTKRHCRRAGFKVQPLCGGEICVPHEHASTAGNLKIHLCTTSYLQPQWLRIIAEGKELLDDVCLSSYSDSKLFVMMRSKVAEKITLRIKQSLKDIGTTIEIPLNAKISQIRTEAQRATNIPRNSQRLILNGAVLHDTYLLGDYLLRKKSKDLSILVTRTIDTSGEVEVVLPLRSPMELKIRVPVSSSLADLIEQLHSRFGIPRDTNLLFTYNDIKLQPHMRWVDCGVTAEMKQVTVQVSVAPKITMKQIAPNIVSYTITQPAPAPVALPPPKAVQKLPDTVTSREKSASSMFRGMKRGFLSNPKPKRTPKDSPDDANEEA